MTQRRRKFVPAFATGARVEIAPHFDAWMRGDRYGTVMKHSERYGVYVKMDRSGRTLRFTPDSLTQMNPRGVRKPSRERKHMNVWKHSTRVILDKRQRRGTRRGAAKAMKRGHRGRKLQALKGQFDRALAMFRKNPMSRKHYIFMAHYINDAKKMGASDDVLNALYKFAIAVIRNDGNERFDEGRFYEASLGGTRRNPALAIVGAANPPGRYLGHVVEVRYVRRGGKYHGQRFRHTFKSRPRLLAMPDGAIRIA